MNNPDRMRTGTTPFPNYLLDAVRPTLKGSEWNLLCVIVRQTLGWSDGQGGRKRTDWLTHGQLKERTGLASASICRAIDSLVKRGIVEVRDGSDRLLGSSPERKAARRLSFGLRLVGENGNRQTPSFQKAKTTKERDIYPFVDFKNENGGGLDVSKIEMVSVPDLKGAPQDILRRYREMFVENQGTLNVPAIHNEDIARLLTYMKKLGPETFNQLLEEFFKSDYQFIKRQKYSFGAFMQSVNILSSRQQKL